LDKIQIFHKKLKKCILILFKNKFIKMIKKILKSKFLKVIYYKKNKNNKKFNLF